MKYERESFFNTGKPTQKVNKLQLLDIIGTRIFKMW